MKKLVTKTFLVAVMSTVAICADNSLGTWKLDGAKSKYNDGTFPVKNLVMVREPLPSGGVKITQTGERRDGTPLNSSYTATYDGKDCTVTGTGSPFDKISIRQLDSNTFIDERRKATGWLLHATVRTVISKDGKTLNTTATGTDVNGKSFSSTLIHERQ